MIETEKQSKYRILFDYGNYEGMKFWDETGYETVDEAVKDALALNLGTPFLIVQIINWQAQQL